MVSASWWVATEAAPSDAATYVVTSSDARRVSVRTTRATPACAARRTPARSGRSGAPSRRAARTTTASSAAADPSWARSVPIAEPAMPRSRPKTRTTFSTMLRRLPTTATTSGVRVSCSPRSTPVAASITSSGTTPRNASRRYVVAGTSTAGPAPNSPTSRPARSTPATVVTVPISTASQTPSTPWASAPRTSPEPTRRATEAVVP